MSIVNLHEVSKSYSSAGSATKVLDGLDLEMQSGEFLALMGPSGSGKSTILNLIGGIDRADSGRVEVAGTRLDTLRPSAFAAWRARHIGFVFQFYNLLPNLSAESNVELPLLLTCLPTRERKRRVELALSLVELTPRRRHRPDELSGGQQQRVAIARALICDPDLLICDEPTGDLDRASAEQVMSLLQSLNVERGKSVVMVTHDPRSAEYATSLVRLDKGRIVRPAGAAAA